jgi:hypothetical protein
VDLCPPAVASSVPGVDWHDVYWVFYYMLVLIWGITAISLFVRRAIIEVTVYWNVRSFPYATYQLWREGQTLVWDLHVDVTMECSAPPPRVVLDRHPLPFGFQEMVTYPVAETLHSWRFVVLSSP